MPLDHYLAIRLPIVVVAGTTNAASYSRTEIAVLVTLVAPQCNDQICLEKVVTTSEQSGITMTACQLHAQIALADWPAKGPYSAWKVQSYKCVIRQISSKKVRPKACCIRIV